jgi:hypothetical protein
MAEKKKDRRVRISKLKTEFGIPDISLPNKEATVTPEMPSESTVAGVIPEGEVYSGSAAKSGGLAGTPKIFSGGRMVIDRSAVRDEDTENRIKEVLSDSRLNQVTKDEEWNAAAKQVREGAVPLALDANESYDHITETHEAIKSFLNKLPESILSKADAHDEAAKAIEKIKAGHPAAQKQRDMANKLRVFVGIPSGMNNIHELRKAKEAVMNGGGTLDNNLNYQLNVHNKLVTAQTKLQQLKRGGETFASDSPSENHPALKAAHKEIMGVNRSINSLLKPLGMSSPVPHSQLTVIDKSVAQLQEPSKTISPDEYRDPHPETEELSKPGHIWGEKPGLGLTDSTKDFNPYAAKDTREREQIPLTKEGKTYIEKTYGKNHPVMTRFRSAKASLNKKNILKTNLRDATPAADDIPTGKPRLAPRIDDLLSTDDGRNDELKDKLTMGQYSEENQRKSGANPAAKFVDTSDAGTIARGARAAAMEGANIDREAKKLTEHHANQAFESLIAGKSVPLATVNFIAGHPQGDQIRARAEQKAAAHISAVAAFKSNHRPTMEHRVILGPAGLRRAQAQAESGE